MDIEDFGFGCFIIFASILIFALVGLAIYATIKDINKDNKIEDYQKCVCEIVDKEYVTNEK